MRALTVDEIRESFVNAFDDDLELFVLPVRIMLLDWHSVDVVGWRDAKAPQRGYLFTEIDDRPVGIVVRAAPSSMSRARSAQCALCHTLQPADQVSLFTARRSSAAGARGDSVGTYMCADLACADTVHLPAPLTPLEVPSAEPALPAGLVQRTRRFIEHVLGE